MYSAEHKDFQAVWYLTGEVFLVSASRSEESTQCNSSLTLQRNDACSSDLMTEMYESWRFVYFPTSAMETESNSRSCLQLNCFSGGNARYSKILPSYPTLFTLRLLSRRNLNSIQPKSFREIFNNLLLSKQQRNMIS